MSHISIGGAVGSGFGLIGRKPLTVLTWGLVRIAFAVGVLAIYLPVLLGVMGPMIQAAQSAAPGASPSDAMTQTMLPQMMALNGAGLLVQLAGLFFAAILYCAVSRSIVHPERGAFAYLRVSLPEVFVTLLTYGASIALTLAIMLCAIPFVIAVVILAVNKMTIAAVIVGILAVVVLIAALIYVLLRFAFIIPMMVDDGKFHFLDAWSLTKGHAGALFMIGLCLMLIGLVGEIVVGAILFALGAVALGVAAGGFDNLQAFFNLPPMTIVTRLGPWLAVFALLAIPLDGCLMAIFMAPWARAYRDVVGPSVASVFEGSPPPPIGPLPPAGPPSAPTPPEPPILPTPTPA
jgi:hypothetical protein